MEVPSCGPQATDNEVLTAASVNILLDENIQQTELERICGRDPAEARQSALAALDQLAESRGWEKDKHQEEIGWLTAELHKPLMEKHYDKWLTEFSKHARAAGDAGDLLDAQTQLDNAKACMTSLADKKGWSAKKIAKETALLESWVSRLEDKPLKVTNRKPNIITRTKNSVDLLAMTAIGHAQETKSTNQNTTESHRKRKLIITGLGTAAVAAVGGYLAYNGHAFGIGGGHHETVKDIVPAKQVPNHHGLASSAPTHHNTTPSKTNHPFNNPSHKHSHSIKGSDHHIAKHQQKTETLSKHGDTIWSHANRQLGRHATQSQVKTYVNKILASNHLTYAKARLLNVGFKFKLPNN